MAILVAILVEIIFDFTVEITTVIITQHIFVVCVGPITSAVFGVFETYTVLSHQRRYYCSDTCTQVHTWYFMLREQSQPKY